MLPLSVSSKTVSTSALSATDAAAASRCSSLLLRFLLPPSDSCATVSTVVLPASDAAAVLLLLSSLLLRFLLLPSVSCATFSTRVLSALVAAAVFFAPFLVSCASFFFFLAAAFFYRDNNFLISFFEFGLFTVVFLGFILVFSIHSRCVLCGPSPGIVFSLRYVDQESSHNTSMVTSHVDHVVGLSVFHIPQVSSLGQNAINLLFFSFRRDEGRLFLRCFSEHRVERRVIV